VAISHAQWLQGLVTALQDALRKTDVPRLDLEWLLARSRDTQGFSGEYRDASFRQLVDDVAQFAEEFPGVLPAILIAPGSIPTPASSQ
jgi:hypothetical protein